MRRQLLPCDVCEGEGVIYRTIDGEETEELCFACLDDGYRTSSWRTLATLTFPQDMREPADG